MSFRQKVYFVVRYLSMQHLYINKAHLEKIYINIFFNLVFACFLNINWKLQYVAVLCLVGQHIASISSTKRGVPCFNYKPRLFKRSLVLLGCVATAPFLLVFCFPVFFPFLFFFVFALSPVLTFPPLPLWLPCADPSNALLSANEIWPSPRSSRALFNVIVNTFSNFSSRMWRFCNMLNAWRE